MAAINFGMIGGAWRALFFMRIARAFPEQFNCAGVVIRNPERRAAFGAEWGVPTYASLDALLDAQTLDYVVVSTSENDRVIVDVVAKGIPCLSETPPGRTHEELVRVYESVREFGGKVQVAEQYHLRPHHQAQRAVIDSGRIGTVSQVQASIAHSYHGVSMVRRFLGVGFENAVIRSTGFTSPIVEGASRAGLPEREEIVDAEQVLAWFHFESGRFGAIDFTAKQSRGWIRKDRMLIRGERGEIAELEVRYLKAFNEPMAFSIERVSHGQEQDLKPVAFVGYRGDGEWFYRTPYAWPILGDDEIAVAHCMERMATFLRNGESFYSLEEAMQDTYLGLLYEQARREDGTIESSTQVWAR